MPQDSELFAGTMSENIFIGGDPSKINHDEFTVLLKSLRLTDLYYRVGEGAYWINEENNNLSGGERRRICLARHLISKPNMLILDEPTTGLDSVSEIDVLNALKEISKSITILMVTHSKAAIDLADNLITID